MLIMSRNEWIAQAGGASESGELDLTRLSSYNYHLPESQIAQSPVSPRDSSRLMVIDRKTGKWEHRRFRDLPQYLDQDDLIVANNTQVIRARLLGQRVRAENGQRVLGGRVEFVMLEEKGPGTWEGLMHASAKYVSGLAFQVPTRSGEWVVGTVVRGSAESPSGTVVVEFDRDPIESGAGELPLPHYISRSESSSERETEREDDERNYQTIYSKMRGSAAAPTAGLHFTADVMAEIGKKGTRWEELTLHVGLGTFRPVKTQDIRDHIMHEERYFISREVAQRLTEWKKSRRRITAVGTTSVRTLESAWVGEQLRSGPGRTSIFIYPGGVGFQVVDRLLTNFHLPQSTLLMLVCAFAGRDLTLDAYREAVREGYRFFSYGDAMLIL